MPVDNAYQRFHQATAIIRQDAPADRWGTPPPSSHGCSICGRPWDDVEDPGVAGAYQYSSSFSREYECTSCHTVRIPARESLGIEMYRGKAQAPSPGRLGMLPSCGAVITPDNQLHMAVNKGFFTKYQGGAIDRAGQLHQERPFTLLMQLIAEQSLSSVSEGAIFISEWGRKPDRLLGNLQLTRSLSELWCCSDAGAECIDLTALIETAKWLHGRELGTKATRPAFWAPIRQAAQGRAISQEAMKKWAKDIPQPQELLDTLPIDPHTRTRLPRFMADIMPWVEGGYL